MAGCNRCIAVRCNDGTNNLFFLSWSAPAPHSLRSGQPDPKVQTVEVLLDAFAGTCGILIEVRSSEQGVLGIDMQPRLVKGARCNLQGLDCSLLLGDAKPPLLHSSSVDAAVVDTPYGRSAKIMAESKDLLLQSLCWQIRA